MAEQIKEDLLEDETKKLEDEEVEIEEESDTEKEDIETDEADDLKQEIHNLKVEKLMLESDIPGELKLLVEDQDISVVVSKVELVKELLAKEELVEGYIPSDKREEDQYKKAIDKKDIKMALKQKLNLR